MTGRNVPLEAKICLLHIFPEDYPVTIRKRIKFCLLQAKCVIALRWKDIQRPTSGQWITELSSNLALENWLTWQGEKLRNFTRCGLLSYPSWVILMCKHFGLDKDCCNHLYDLKKLLVCSMTRIVVLWRRNGDDRTVDLQILDGWIFFFFNIIWNVCMLNFLNIFMY